MHHTKLLVSIYYNNTDTSITHVIKKIKEANVQPSLSNEKDIGTVLYEKDREMLEEWAHYILDCFDENEVRVVDGVKYNRVAIYSSELWVHSYENWCRYLYKKMENQDGIGFDIRAEDEEGKICINQKVDEPVTIHYPQY